jgi:hypothetical protein
MKLEQWTVLLQILVSHRETLMKSMLEVLQVLVLLELPKVDQEATLVQGHILELPLLEVLLPHLTVPQDLLVEQKISVLRG